MGFVIDFNPQPPEKIQLTLEIWLLFNHYDVPMIILLVLLATTYTHCLYFQNEKDKYSKIIFSHEICFLLKHLHSIILFSVLLYKSLAIASMQRDILGAWTQLDYANMLREALKKKSFNKELFLKGGRGSI